MTNPIIATAPAQPCSKYCSNCQLDLPIDKFSKNMATRDKKQNQCQECFNTYQRNRGYGLVKSAERQPVGVGQLATARTFVRAEAYVPDKTLVYRNTGNKHILSLGLPT